MLPFSTSRFLQTALVCALLTLSACTPKYDWREVRGADAAFVVLLPAKATSYSRPVTLDGKKVTMTMSAAEVDGVTFAVATAKFADAAQAQAALIAMKIAMVKNIDGTIKLEKSSTSDKTNGAAVDRISTIEIDASGSAGTNTGGQARRLIARFVARDNRVYQVMMVGSAKAMKPEAIDTFFTSFKLN